MKMRQGLILNLENTQTSFPSKSPVMIDQDAKNEYTNQTTYDYKLIPPNIVQTGQIGQQETTMIEKLFYNTQPYETCLTADLVDDPLLSAQKVNEAPVQTDKKMITLEN